MTTLFDNIADYSYWLLAFGPFLCLVVWDAIESRWDAYSRKRAYEELKLLNELREKGILTQEEFDEKKGELLLCS
jgi:hypothetical protein